jgi:two-component system, NtrC family, response regulator AtoC
MRFMREYFEGHRDNPREDTPPEIGSARAANWARLEEVGDLHALASSYTSAVDYYQQIYSGQQFSRLSASDGLRILRKSIDCHILLGKFDQAETLLNRADDQFSKIINEDDEPGIVVLRARFQVRRAILLRETFQLHECLRLAKRAFAVLALTDEHKDVARVQAVMGIAHHRLGRMEKAEEFYNDSLATYRRIGFDLGVANLLNNLALIKKNKCLWEPALSLMEKATTLANQIGASHLLPGFYLNQGIVLTKSNRHGEARPFLEKGRNMARSLGDLLHLCRLNLALGRLEALSGRLARAEELLLEGKCLAEQNRYLRESIIADEYLGDVLLARGQFEKAQFNYQLGLEKSRSIASGTDIEGELLRRVGEAHLAMGNFQDAVAVSQAAVSVCEQCGEIYELGFCHLVLGKAYSGLNDDQQLRHHFQEAISIFREQDLKGQWCGAILDFTHESQDKASEAQLLLLRRYLMDAQERGASSVSDRMLCRILESLASIQIQLGHFDDSLLSVFELERLASGLEDDTLDRAVVILRDKIEFGLLGDADSSDDHLLAISSIPGLFSRNDSSIPRNLKSVLGASMDRVGADSGFIAMVDDSIGKESLSIVSHSGLTENLAQQLTRWYDGQLASEARPAASFYSRLGPDDLLIQDVPALASAAGSCVFLPIALNERRFGMLFLGKAPLDGQSVGFARNALDFLSTYMGFLALFLFEKGKRNHNLALSTPIQRVESFENIITHSDQMLEVLGLAQKVAPSDLTILLTGETGTGKGLLAYSIHALSRRADQKFLQINCAAIPDALLESELFGHVKGAFTGADSDKTGLLESAVGGTVFLDEIGKMPLNMQGKLLQFLDTKVVRPVGGNVERIVNVRLIAASKTDLHAASLQGNFLEDLYYRLLDFPLNIPPLRERADDVQLLTRHFVQRFSQELGGDLLAVDHQFMDTLTHFAWPGNVRELEKVLKRAIVLAQGEGVLRVEHLPVAMVQTPKAETPVANTVSPLKETMAVIECQEISKALRASKGNKSQAARLLKISYPNLLKKIRHYGV